MNRQLAYLLAVVMAGPAFAVTLEDCERTTHPSHAGEADHRDFGGGHVSYVEWWSQEGVYTDAVVANCRSGVFFRTRLKEERISERLAFDQVEKGMSLIETEMKAAPSLVSFERLAEALDRVGRDNQIAMMNEETCACAAVYPDLRGQKEPYQRDK